MIIKSIQSFVIFESYGDTTADVDHNISSLWRNDNISGNEFSQNQENEGHNHQNCGNAESQRETVLSFETMDIFSKDRCNKC